MSSSDGDGEPPVKIPKKEATVEELSDILSQPTEILLQIVNHLDAKSLRNLAFTCKSLFDFCLNAKGINISFTVDEVALLWDWTNHGFVNYNFRCQFGLRCEDPGSFEMYLETLLKWPFAIAIGELDLQHLKRPWRAVKLEIKEFLERNGVKKIRKVNSINTPTTVEEAKDFSAEFVEAFEIEEVVFECWDGNFPETITACLQMPLKRLKMLQMEDFEPSTIPEFSVPFIWLDAGLFFRGFDNVIVEWRTRNDLKSWTFRYPSDFDFMAWFEDEEIRVSSSTAPIDPKKPPVFMEIWGGFRSNKTINFYLLREDRKVIRVAIDPPGAEDERCVEFSLCPLEDVPPAFQGL